MSKQVKEEAQKKLIILEAILTIMSDNDIDIISFTYNDSRYNFEVKNIRLFDSNTYQENEDVILDLSFILKNLKSKEIIAPISTFRFPIADIISLECIKQRTNPVIHLCQIKLENERIATFSVKNLKKYQKRIEQANKKYPDIIILK